MMAAVDAELPGADAFVAVAAVADWHVTNASSTKLKKAKGAPPPALEFAPNPDILAAVAARPDAPYCVGFAAESDAVLEHARAKRLAKGIPLIVANRAQDALGADQTELTLIDAAGETRLPAASKLAQARRLVAEIARRLDAHSPRRA
jgi:phosphopantothenoylcysteine decarboxylase/phosphopantothenate--cysteine ligase